MKRPKHVIFLGAGASVTSGYPLAEQLRKDWLSSVSALKAKLYVALEDVHLKNEATQLFDDWIRKSEPSLKLFREGCFGSIDEFCYHVRSTRPKDVETLKGVLRFVFGLHVPETNFTKSDYYPFIQKLFKPTDLSVLRDDVVVLSYNYDPYLEWLLQRALCTRLKAVELSPADTLAKIQKATALATSGFQGTNAALKEIRDGDGFCILKLHGMAAWPNPVLNDDHKELNDHCSFEDFFAPAPARRISSLTGIAGSTVPPIVFPWEVFAQDGSLITSDKFALKDEAYIHSGIPYRNGGRAHHDPSLHDIYSAVWERAHAEVQSADKISFVGLSMNQLLEPGIKRLFLDKVGTVELAMTHDGLLAAPVRNSPAFRLLAWLEKYGPAMRIRKTIDRVTFSDFIYHEL